jgi:hypothetical protein
MTAADLGAKTIVTDDLARNDGAMLRLEHGGLSG